MYSKEFPKLRAVSNKPSLRPSSAMKPPPASELRKQVNTCPEPFFDKLRATVMNVLSPTPRLPQQVSSSPDSSTPTPPTYSEQVTHSPSRDNILPVLEFHMSCLSPKSSSSSDSAMKPPVSRAQVPITVTTVSSVGSVCPSTKLATSLHSSGSVASNRGEDIEKTMSNLSVRSTRTTPKESERSQYSQKHNSTQGSINSTKSAGSIKSSPSIASIKSSQSVSSKMPHSLYSFNKPVGRSRISGTSESKSAKELEADDDESTIPSVKSHKSERSFQSAKTPQLVTRSLSNSSVKSYHPPI